MTSTSTQGRSGVTRASAALLALLTLAHAAAVIYFVLIVPDDPLGPGLLFGAVAVAGAVTALAAVPGLLRHSLVAWIIAICWIVAITFWGVYKIAYENEIEGLIAQALGYLLIALLIGSRPVQLRSSPERGSR